MSRLSVNPETPATKAAVAIPAISPLETEVIDLFVHLARLLGLPKSTAEIYGLLFTSLRPLAMEDLIQRLALSKGSASQGLKFLRNLGAIKTVYVPGSRKDYYVAETEMRQFASGLIKEKLNPHFDQSLARLQRIEALLKEMPSGERNGLTQRLDKLRQWEKRGKQFLPLLAKLLG